MLVLNFLVPLATHKEEDTVHLDSPTSKTLEDPEEHPTHQSILELESTSKPYLAVAPVSKDILHKKCNDYWFGFFSGIVLVAFLHILLICLQLTTDMTLPGRPSVEKFHRGDACKIMVMYADEQNAR